MAKLQLNSALSSISGAIDNWVYRRRAGRMVIGRRPMFTDPRTPAQLATREQFRQAASYARAAGADPTLRAFYDGLARTRQQPVFSLMLTDYLKPPVVDEIVLTDYHGQVDDRIVIRASDDVGVTGVMVKLQAADDSVLEEGAAVLEGGAWVYRGTTAPPAGDPVTITATAVDRPGHTGVKTATWSS